ncbi:MAG: hypothetical protein RLY20_553 [Verrucomicrobiota bacterium]|jgi:hypothetical protein
MKLIVRFMCFVGLAMFAAAVQAHGPYDSSAQLRILDAGFETVAVLGMEGAKQALIKGGLSEAQADTALTVRGPSSRFNVSPGLAPQFLEVSRAGKALVPRSFTVITDGLEASFTASYVQVPAGAIAVRARYLDAVESMKPGAFTVLDENSNIKSQSVFARSSPKTSVTLMDQPQTEQAGSVPTPVGAPSVKLHATNPPANTSPVSLSSSSRSWGLALVVFGVFALAVGVLMRRR